ncbi:MAG: tRNA lysidine(34) synthetase TilS [Eubacterium sp.]
MINKVLNFVKHNKILEYGDSVILGVSGGADSICMLYVLHKLKDTLGLTLHVVHVNHHIRGQEAQRDADYVKDTCEKLGVEFVQIDVDIPKMAKKNGMSEEEAGRQARYQAFNDMASRVGAGKIAVAHNLNDNSETVLFHLFRGTGIKGLTGISFKRERIVRPLLCCTRQEIENYLLSENIDFCTDSTNTDMEYSRNKIRLELLPYIKENINHKAEYNIVNAAENLGEISDFLDKEAKKAYDEYVEDNTFLEKGFGLHPALQNQMVRMIIENQAGRLKDVTRTHILSVIALKDMTVSKSISLPYNLIAIRTYKGIWVKKKNEKKNTPAKEEILIQDGKILKNENIEISLEAKEFNIQNIEELVYTKWLDYDKIQGLVLRNRQKGDYIVIDDKGKRKKLKDYFINEKIPRDERDQILLLADGSHVVWIVGYRISSYYKVTESTSQIIKLIYKQ